MDIGFIGLGHMGFPISRRLVEKNHDVVAFDTNTAALQRIVALGAQPASSPRDVADRVETVMASLPSPAASLEVATGATGVIEGSRVKRYLELSTVGSQTATRIHDLLAQRNIVALDGPVSGGVSGAENGMLAVMVSGPRAEFDVIRTVLEAIGRPFYLGDKPGSAPPTRSAGSGSPQRAIRAPTRTSPRSSSRWRGPPASQLAKRADGRLEIILGMRMILYSKKNDAYDGLAI